MLRPEEERRNPEELLRKDQPLQQGEERKQGVGLKWTPSEDTGVRYWPVTEELKLKKGPWKESIQRDIIERLWPIASLKLFVVVVCWLLNVPATG